MKIKEIKKAIKKFEAYDRVYFDGRLSSALIVVLCFIIIILIQFLKNVNIFYIIFQSLYYIFCFYKLICKF